MAEQDHIEMAGLRGTLRRAEPMSRHVSWRAGGVADGVYEPADHADLALFLSRLAPEEPVCFVGLGSNLLVRDGGYRGTVILTHKTQSVIRLDDAPPGESLQAVYAEAGAASPKVARFAANHGFEGAEFLVGIPGTVGGALAMNAGCYGAETWDVVTRAQTVDRGGRLHVRASGEFEVGYRHCALPGARLGENEWFTAAWFRFPPGDRERARSRITELLARRVASQPLDLPNAGSVFRNPPGDYAARLVEACGLKGHAIGGARISEKHANFIVNPGGRARAADIEALIEHARATVRLRFDVELRTEVRIIGDAA